MVVENIEQSVLKKLYDNDKTVIYAKLVPYKNNTAIKVYNSESGEPLGDIPESEIEKYLNKETEVLFITQKFDDNTGLFSYKLATIV